MFVIFSKINYVSFLLQQVKPSGSPVPTIVGAGVSLSSSAGPSSTASTIIQNAPIAVPVTIPVAKFHAAIRPSGTVTLAPRVVPTASVTTSGTYASLPSHVPKGMYTE